MDGSRAAAWQPEPGWQRLPGAGPATVGLWSATPYDRKATPFGRYELMHFLEGQVELHDGGTSGQAFQAGETIFVPKGVPLGWRNKIDVKKIFVILMPNG